MVRFAARTHWGAELVKISRVPKPVVIALAESKLVRLRFRRESTDSIDANAGLNKKKTGNFKFLKRSFSGKATP